MRLPLTEPSREHVYYQGFLTSLPTTSGSTDQLLIKIFIIECIHLNTFISNYHLPITFHYPVLQCRTHLVKKSKFSKSLYRPRYHPLFHL